MRRSLSLATPAGNDHYSRRPNSFQANHLSPTSSTRANTGSYLFPKSRVGLQPAATAASVRETRLTADKTVKLEPRPPEQTAGPGRSVILAIEATAAVEIEPDEDDKGDEANSGAPFESPAKVPLLGSARNVERKGNLRERRIRRRVQFENRRARFAEHPTNSLEVPDPDGFCGKGGRERRGSDVGDSDDEEDG